MQPPPKPPHSELPHFIQNSSQMSLCQVSNPHSSFKITSCVLLYLLKYPPPAVSSLPFSMPLSPPHVIHLRHTITMRAEVLVNFLTTPKELTEPAIQKVINSMLNE